MTISSKIGFGKKVSGQIVLFGEKGKTVNSRDLTGEISGKIVIFLTFAPREFIEKVNFLGAVGIIVPSMHYVDYEYFSKDNDFSLLLLLKFGKLDLPEELGLKLEKLSGKSGELDGEGKTLEIGH